MKAQLRIADTASKGFSRRFNFNKEALAAIKPPVTGRIRVYDTKEPGLEFMVTANGARSFNLYRWDPKTQRPIRGKIKDVDTVEQARAKARELKGIMAKGDDPFADRKAIRQSSTLAEMWEHYKENQIKVRGRGRTETVMQSLWDNCFESWKPRKVMAVTATDINSKHIEIGKDKGKTTANRAMELMRAMFNFCNIEPNPASSKNWDRFDEATRTRFLQANELQRVENELAKLENQTAADALRMALYTGARKSAVAAMKWADINLAAGIWTIPAINSKNGKPLTVHLLDPARRLLKARAGCDDEFVFPGKFPGTHIHEPRRAWEAVREAAKLDDVRQHDLRRTFGAWQVASGVPIEHIARQLGQDSTEATKIYTPLNLAPIRKGLERGMDAMQAAMKPKAKKGGKRQKKTTVKK